MEEVIYSNLTVDLFKQMVTYAAIASVVIYGIKNAIKAIKKMKQEDKLPPVVGIALMGVFGIAFSFILQSPIIVNIAVRLFFGIVIAAVGFASYGAVISSLLKLIPSVMKKFFG